MEQDFLSNQVDPLYSFITRQSSSVGADTMLPGMMDQVVPTFIPRYLEGQSAVTIRHVACGDMFTACLTGRYLVVTMILIRE